MESLEVVMKQSEVEEILLKVEAAVEASHRAQLELLQAVRLLFSEKEAIAKPKALSERDPDIELAALDDAIYDGLPDQAVFTVDELANLLRVSKASIYNMVKQRRLRSLSFGRQVRIPRRALVAYFRGMNVDEFDAFIKRKAEERYGK